MGDTSIETEDVKQRKQEETLKALIAVQEIPKLLREILKTLQVIEIKLPTEGSTRWVRWVQELPRGKVVRSKRVK